MKPATLFLFTVLIANSNTSWSNADAASEQSATGIVLKEPLDPVLGEAQTCLRSREIKTIEILSDKVLVIKGSHGRYWLNRLTHACAGLGRNMILKLGSFGNQVCANDRFQAFEPHDVGIFAAECRWSKFEPAAIEQIAMIKSELKQS